MGIQLINSDVWNIEFNLTKDMNKENRKKFIQRIVNKYTSKDNIIILSAKFLKNYFTQQNTKTTG